MQILVKLLDAEATLVAEKIMDLTLVANVTIFTYKGINYCFSSMPSFNKGVIFRECGTIEEF